MNKNVALFGYTKQHMISYIICSQFIVHRLKPDSVLLYSRVHHIFEIGIVNSLVVRKNGQTTYQILILVSVVSPRCAFARKLATIMAFSTLIYNKDDISVRLCFLLIKTTFEQCARCHFVYQNYQNDCVKKKI